MTRRTLSIALALAAMAVVSCDDGGGATPTDTASSDATATDGSDTPSGDVTGDVSSDAPQDGGEETVEPPVTPSVCAAVRGNGTRIFSHFGALARIHEHYGPLAGAAGGSSASITTFLTESIYANPYVFDCGGSPCDDRTASARISLLFKSLPGYFSVLSDTDEVQAFQSLAPLVAAAQEEGIGAIFESDDLAAGRDALDQLLNSPETADIVNDEVLALLAGDDALFHAVETWDQLSTFGAFAVDSARIFLRPGIIDFAQLADKIGRIGSFYAAYGPADAAAWASFLDACAEPARGLEWASIAGIEAEGSTCGALYADLATTYRAAFLAAGEMPNRIQDPVGLHLDTLAITAVLTGDSVGVWRAAYEDYIAAAEYTFDVSFDDVRFGYFGSDDVLARVAQNERGYTDEKTARFYPLEGHTWRTALATSPAEPGLARGIEVEDVVSIGGWPDLEPSLVLRNMGCDEVILVTRQGDVRGFGFEVAGQLNANPAELDALYDMDVAQTSIVRSLEEATGHWCSDWDGFGGFDFAGVYTDGFQAPMESTSEALTSGASAYGNISDELGIAGCTPGVDPR